MIQGKPPLLTPISNKRNAKRSPTSPGAKYCTLRIFNEDMPNQYFTVEVKADGEVVELYQTCWSTNLVEYLYGFGIFSDDVMGAFEICEAHGHNVVEFGLFGSPVGSRFEGTLQ